MPQIQTTYWQSR